MKKPHAPLAALVTVAAACSPMSSSPEGATTVTSSPASPEPLAASAGPTADAVHTSSALVSEPKRPGDWAPNARVFYGQAPDDGAAYIVTLGDRREAPSNTGHDCDIPKTGTGLYLSLGYKGFPRPAPVSRPSQLAFVMGPNQDITEGWSCRAGSGCVGFDAGAVQLELLQPESHARGTYRLIRRDGAVQEGHFDAEWCVGRFDHQGPSFP
jgi:hypothetical protein